MTTSLAIEQTSECGNDYWTGFGEKALSLFNGTVMHARLKPFGHRFTYSVFNILIDLDRLEEANKRSTFFSVNRFNAVSFHERDHGAGTEEALSTQIRKLLNENGIRDEISRISLLCYPRIFGYVFNPISIYFCEDKNGLIAMVYEVRNTFGGMHTYVEPLKPGQLRQSGLRQECDKIFHVSPFLAMKMRYFFRIQYVQDKLTVRILEEDEKGPILAATLSAKQAEASSKALITRLLKVPFLTFKVMAAIHFEALKLWLKGAQYHRNPHKT